MMNPRVQAESNEIADDWDQLGELVDEIAADVGVSGVIRVDLDGRAPVQRAYGLAHRGLGVPTTVDTQFGTASGSKGLTALVVMGLVARGEIALDTTARSLLGADLPMIDDRVTVEHLLAHRSGIGDYLDEDEVGDNNDYVLTVPVHELATTEQFLAVLDGHPTKHEPGERFTYCNGGYVVLALLAERASGVPFHDLVDERVCRPAGTTSTSFLRTDELPGRAAVGYLDEDGLRTNALHLSVRGNGDGGIYTTAADLHTFWAALFAGRIVSLDTVAAMVQSRSEVPDMSMSYGLGFWLDDTTGTVLMLGGDAGVGFVSTHHPARRSTITVLCNQTRGMASQSTPQPTVHTNRPHERRRGGRQPRNGPHIVTRRGNIMAIADIVLTEVTALRATVRGEVLLPGDEGYDAARAVWNAMIDRRPAVIVRPVGVADVMTAVNFARETGLVLSVRGGAHNVTGSAVCDSGLMLDMSSMKSIRVDPEDRSVRAEAGCLWKELDHETQAFGLAVTGGQASDTGIAGLTLGGGVGQLMRFCGATVDNLLSVDLVTADGQLLTVDAVRHSDLFWAVRGGGGNFGVVTSFHYRLHEVGPIILGGMLLYPASKATDLLRCYRDVMLDAPDELNITVAFLTAPYEPSVPAELRGQPAIGVLVCTSETSRPGSNSSNRCVRPFPRTSTWSLPSRIKCIRR